MGSHSALRQQANEGRADRLADIAHVKRGVHAHERHLHPGEKETKLANGGRVPDEADDSRGYPTDAPALRPALTRGLDYAEGKARANGGRLDRKRGGKAKAHGKSGSKVNVIVQAPQPQPPQRVPVPVPMGGAGGGPPRPPMMPPPGAGMPPPPGAMPSGAMPPGGPQGMPPGGMPPRPPMAGPPPGAMPPGVPPHKSGGDVGRRNGGMTAGAGSGLGRLEKTRAAEEEDREPRKDGGKAFKPGGTPGKLHREIGVPVGDKIPAKKLAKAAKSGNPEIRRDAIRAKTMEGWDHG